MRLFVGFLLVVALIVGLGFYRGWFGLSSDRSDDKSNVTLTVDKDKVHQDAQVAKDKVRGAGDKAAANVDKK